MTTYFAIVLGLALFDVLLVVGFYVFMWSYRSMSNRDRLITAAGLVVNAVQRYMILSGLYV